MSTPILVYPDRYTDAREVVANNAALDTTSHDPEAVAWCRLALDAVRGHVRFIVPPMQPNVTLVAPVRPASRAVAA